MYPPMVHPERSALQKPWEPVCTGTESEKHCSHWDALRTCCDCDENDEPDDDDDDY